MSSQKNRNDEKQSSLEQEIATHLEMSARDREERGVSPQQAAEAARRDFGNVALVEHVTRDQWRGRWFEDFTQDLRHGARLLRRNSQRFGCDEARWQGGLGHRRRPACGPWGPASG